MDLGLDLIETITNNFSEDQKIGSGGYGDVYKAVYDGKEIAVKKLHPFQALDNKQFNNELRNHTKVVSHKNIIRLLGYCYESRSKYTEHNGENVWATSIERVLCLEYMQGGNLEKYIADHSCHLDWQTCYNIIRGTCEGLNHLHSPPENPILHLDLKPSNIFLDENMTPKIADLGFSRIVSSETLQTDFIMGTPGYMPPEYLDKHIISKKSDVFSFGVIIIKMLAGNTGYFRCYEMLPKEFIKFVSEIWKKRLQATSGLYSSHETDLLQVHRCAEIALRCVDKDREKRPYVNDIVHELDELEVQIESMILHSHGSKDQILQVRMYH